MNPEQLHVLLIGIDAYDGGGSLRGCVNDVDAVQGVLLDRLGVPTERVTRLVSPRSGAGHDTRIAGRLPTLAAITGELDRLAGDDVAPSDRVFVYFSGHGTQLVLEDAEGRRFPREALLPKDKVRGPDTLVLADWELNAAMARIGARCHSATVVLDCCSSAGATRSLNVDSGTTRFWPTDTVRSIADAATALGDGVRGVAEGLVARIDNCQVVAACQADERAKEDSLGGQTMGHLTRSLCEQLQAVDGDLSELRWGRIWRRVEAAVVGRNPQQHPWLSSGFGRAVFGGDPDDRGDVGFGVVPHGDRFRVDVGTLAGVTTGARIAVYGPDPVVFPALDSPDDRAARVGELLVEASNRVSCTGTPVAPMTLPEAARARLVAPGTDATIAVVLQPHVEEVASALRRSPFVDVTVDVRHADLELHERNGDWILADDLHGPGHGLPSFPPVPGERTDILRSVVEHYYRYSAPLRLAHACRDLPTLLRLSVLDCNGHRGLTAAEAQTVALPEVTGTDRARYEASAGDLVCIAVHNNSDRGLYVTLLDAAASGRVFVLGTGQIPPHGRERFWVDGALGSPFEATLPDGRDVGVDRIVAVGTTAKGVDLRHLRQDTCFAELVRRERGVLSRDLAAPAGAAPVEQYTSATADLWVRRSSGRHHP